MGDDKMTAGLENPERLGRSGWAVKPVPALSGHCEIEQAIGCFDRFSPADPVGDVVFLGAQALCFGK